MKQTSRLREMLKRGMVIAAGSWDALSAKMVQDQGFEAVYMSGAAVTGSMIGKTDLGYVTQTEMVDAVRRITRAVDIPVIADADEGFGNPLNVQRTIRLYEQAGAAALHIEDMALPKRCVHLGGGSLAPKEAMVQKIRAAVAARQDPDLVLIARTDNYEGVDELIARAKAYAEAGADMIFPIGLETVDDMWRICREVPIPPVEAQTAGSKSPNLPPAELEAMGYKMLLFVVGGYISAYFAQLEFLKNLKRGLENRSKAPPLGLGFSEFRELDEVLGMSEDARLQKEYFPKT